MEDDETAGDLEKLPDVDVTSRELERLPDADATWAQSEVPRPDPPDQNPHEKRLRALAGRTDPYDGPIVAIAQGWVSRDSHARIFAARFLDFAVITDEHLMFCSTGFFTRRPKRRVFLEPFKQLGIVAIGSEPYRTLRIVGDFTSPLLFELHDDTNSLGFVHEILQRTRTGREFLTAKRLPPAKEQNVLPPADELDALPAPDEQAALAAPDEQAALPVAEADETTS